jgi:hypothetical protein
MSFWTTMVLSDGIVGISALSVNEILYFGGSLGLPNNLEKSVEMTDLQEK